MSTNPFNSNWDLLQAKASTIDSNRQEAPSTSSDITGTTITAGASTGSTCCFSTGLSSDTTSSDRSAVFGITTKNRSTIVHEQRYARANTYEPTTPPWNRLLLFPAPASPTPSTHTTRRITTLNTTPPSPPFVPTETFAPSCKTVTQRNVFYRTTHFVHRLPQKLKLVLPASFATRMEDGFIDV